MARMRARGVLATVASLAVVGAFGAGAAALAKNGVEFDPGQFVSAYTQGANDESQGYRANPVQANAAANRQGDDFNTDASTGNQGIDDAFSDMPLDGQSGTTAYNLLGRASDGVLVATSNGSAANGTGAAGQTVPIAGNGSGSGNGAAGSNGSGSGSNGANSNNGGNSNNPNNPSGSEDINQPWVNPLPNDPTPEKRNDTAGPYDDPYIEANGANSPLANLTEEEADSIRFRITEDYWGEYPLYEGQTIDGWTVFCALNSMFRYDGTNYTWSCTKEEYPDYPLFQVIMPNGQKTDTASGTMEFTIRYRFNDKMEWRETTVEYSVRDYIFYVTNFAPTDGSDTQIFARADSNDPTTFPYNFYRWTCDVLGVSDGEPISKLLLNWVDNGQPVSDPYFYQITPGRHVVSPGKLALIPAGLDASCEIYWFGDSLGELDGSNLAYLQTLTGAQTSSSAYMVAPDGSSTLVVPNGFQAIKAGAAGISANKLVIPASTVRIDVANGNLHVYDSYSVAADNPMYASTADGILETKDGSEYCGIPLNLHTLNVAPAVRKINFTPGNSIDTVVMEGETLDEIPDIDFDALGACNIVLNDDVFDEYIVQHSEELSGSDELTVSKASNPSVKYRLENGMVYNNSDLLRVLDVGQTSVAIRTPHTIKAGAFDSCEGVESVVLADDAPFTLEDGCFANSSVNLVVCETQVQLEYVTSRLDAAGAPNATVALSDGNAEGYRWYISANGLRGMQVTLLEAPANITEFMGTVTTDAGEVLDITALGPNAFSQCKALRWVQLDETTKIIGPAAFSGCTSLEGVLINSTDEISAEQGAFANCDSLGYVASMAHKGTFHGSERPNGCLMYAPTDCEGYDSRFISFGSGWEISGFAMVDVGDDCRVLYATSDAGSFYEGDWMALASGCRMPAQAKLPESTVRIYAGAFAGVDTPFQLNWGDLDLLETVDGRATMVSATSSFTVLGSFENSAISGEAHIGTSSTASVSIGEYAFSGCDSLESVTVQGSWLWLASGAFFQCDVLSSATIANGSSYSSMESGAFSGCDNLHDIYFDSWDPITLDLFYEGAPYSFLDMLDSDEEAAALRLHVPEYFEEDYLNAWIYSLAGYIDYDSLRDEVWWNLFAETGSWPSDSFVKKGMAEVLLPAENRARTMLGMDLVDQSSIIGVQEANGATFITEDGVVQLTEINSDAAVIDLDAIIPDSLASEGVQIMEGAFDLCPNMTTLIMSSKVNALSNWVLSGQSGVTLVIPSMDALPMLVGGDWFSPFDFACDDFHIQVPAEIQRDVVREWTLQGAMGVYNEDMLAMYVQMFYTPGDTQEEYDEQLNTLFLMDTENALRGYMGLPAVDDYRDLWSFVNTADYVTAHDADDDGEEDESDDPWNDDGDDDIDEGDAAGSDADAENAPASQGEQPDAAVQVASGQASIRGEARQSGLAA